MTWGYLAAEALYVAGLLALIFLSVVALFKTRAWISVFEALMLFGVCASAITLFESPPRPGVVGLVTCASVLCVSAYRRWRKLEAERRAAGEAAAQAAAAATAAAQAATMAAYAATDTAVMADSAEAKEAAAAATVAATDAVAGAAEAVQAASAVSSEQSIREAAALARELAATQATRRYGDENH